MTVIQQPAAGATAAVLGVGSALIAAIWHDGGHERVRYFTEEAQARSFLADHAPDDALSAIGAWGDLDWDDFERWTAERKKEETICPPADDLEFD